MNTEMQFKNATFEFKREPDMDGEFEGYASVFGIVDEGMDVVERGAFAKSLATRTPKMLWQHGADKPIGVWTEVKEDERGLFVKGRLLKEVQQGKEAMALIKAGAIDSMSIGYRVKEASSEGNGAVRKLLEVELFEISLVTFPMLPAAMITDVKSIKTIRDFEKSLRDAGFSKKEAMAIAADGFKGLAMHRDDVVSEPDYEGFAALKKHLAKLQENLNG